MKRFFSAAKLWVKIEELFIGIMSVFALTLVCFEVVARYFFPAYLPDWGAEITIYLTITAILIAGGPLVAEGRHIRADIFVRALPEKPKIFIEFTSLTIGFTYCAIVAKLGIDVVQFAQFLDERSESSIQFPLWIFYVALPTGFMLMTIRYAVSIWKFIFNFDISMLPGSEGEVQRLKKSQS